MEIQLTAKQLKVTPAIRDYVQQKMDKAQKYFDHIVWGQAILFVEKRAHNAEMLIHAPGQTFRALATAADLYSAIDLASDKIDAQLKKHKERLKRRHKGPSNEEIPLPLPPEPLPVVRQTVEPMSAERAAERLEEEERVFLAYWDEKADQLQIVFRRADESLAVIQPVRRVRR